MANIVNPYRQLKGAGVPPVAAASQRTAASSSRSSSRPSGSRKADVAESPTGDTEHHRSLPSNWVDPTGHHGGGDKGSSSRKASVQDALPRMSARHNMNPRSAAEETQFAPDGQYSPHSYGGYRDDISQAVGNKQARMFDKTGQINAYDSKDALQQIAYLLNNVTKQASPGTFYREASTMDPQDRRKILAAAMSDPSQEGFAIVGQELLLPIKDIIDYEGWARKVFRVRPLAQGELFRIAKDVRATAWVVGQDGQSIEARLYGKYIQPSEFKVTSFPTVDIEDIYQMNFDVLDRAQDTARQEIELEEDKRAQGIISKASTTVNSATIFTTLGIGPLEAIRFQVERNRLVVEKFLINRQELSDLVNTAVGLNSSGERVDPVTERELILAGYVGNALNAQIITGAGTGVEQVVPAGTVYAVTGSEYLGEMGVRVELFSEPFNMFSQRRLVKGWAFGEIIGFAIPNPRAVSQGHK
jgi:hypothetical protein